MPVIFEDALNVSAMGKHPILEEGAPQSRVHTY